MDKWTEIQLFLQTADQGSVSRAAEILGISSSAASRHLANLEARLGARLVERNTRRLFLTEVGNEFYQRCRNITSEMEVAESLVSSTQLDPVGTLRVTASVSFCAQILAPLLPAFNLRYPRLKLVVVAANRYLDLVESGIDLAIRTREAEIDSGLVTRPLAETRRILAASPDYLARHGTPQSPHDLINHPFLLYTLATTPYELALSKGDEQLSVKISGLLESNEGQVIYRAGLAGLGIIVQPAYIIYEDILAGRLVPILDDWELPRLKISIAYPSRKYVASKSRALIDFLTTHFDEMDYMMHWTQHWPSR